MKQPIRFVHETIEHGDYNSSRFVPVELTPEGVSAMMDTCPYLKRARFSEDAVLTSRTTDEIDNQRAADAARVANELAETGVSEIGWVTYRVARRIHAPLLHAAGFDPKLIAQALA